MKSFYYLIFLFLFTVSPGILFAQVPQSDSPVKYELKPYEAPELPDVTLPVPAEIPPELAKPLTAFEAASIALVCQPKIAVARASLMSAQGNVKTVSSAANPLVSAAVNYQAQSAAYGKNPTSQNADNSSVSTYGMSASLSQLLYDFNHTRSLVREALSLERSFFENLSQTEADVVLEVKQSFYKYLQAAKLVDVYELNLENQKEHLKMAQERFKAGVGLPSDVVRSQAAVSEAVFSLTQAKTDAGVSRVNLALSMGVDPRIPIEAVNNPEPEIDLSELEAMYGKALKNRPEFLKAVADLEAAKHAVAAASSINAPVISGQAGWVGKDRSVLPEYGYFTAGVFLTMPLTDGGYASGRIEQAKAAEMAAQAQLRLVEQNIVRDVSNAYLSLRNAKQALITAEAEVDSAREAHRLSQGRYKAGVGILLDVLDAQNAMLRAETNVINAQSVLDQARASIKWAIGFGLGTTSL